MKKPVAETVPPPAVPENFAISARSPERLICAFRPSMPMGTEAEKKTGVF